MLSREANWRAALWVGVGLTVLGPALGFVGTLFGMQRSFERIERMKAPTPQQLREGVYESVSFTTIGVAFGAAGVLLLLVALWRLSRLRELRDAEALAQEPWR